MTNCQDTVVTMLGHDHHVSVSSRQSSVQLKVRMDHQNILLMKRMDGPSSLTRHHLELTTACCAATQHSLESDIRQGAVSEFCLFVMLLSILL